MNAVEYQVAVFADTGATPAGREWDVTAESPRQAADIAIEDHRNVIGEGEAVLVCGPGGFFRYYARPDPTLRAMPA